jgi:hypothetical protein
MVDYQSQVTGQEMVGKDFAYLEIFSPETCRGEGGQRATGLLHLCCSDFMITSVMGKQLLRVRISVYRAQCGASDEMSLNSRGQEAVEQSVR